MFIFRQRWLSILSGESFFYIAEVTMQSMRSHRDILVEKYRYTSPKTVENG